MNKLKITLTEFAEPKSFSFNQLKDWFPGKFDKRQVWELIKKWINTNQKFLEFLGISYHFDNEKGLFLEATDKIGLAPIKNPFGKKTYGSLIVKPRVGYIEISEILNSIEWKLRPEFINTEEPLLSDGVLPRWLKAIETLKSIDKALQCHLRGAKNIWDVRNSPLGKVDWYDYSTQKFPFGKWATFFCTLPDFSLDIEIHRQFKGIIFQIENDLKGKYVPERIKMEALPNLQKLKTILEKIDPEQPDIEKLKNAKVPPFFYSVYEEAIKRAVEYVFQSRFSTYSGELYGLPWTIKMDQLFEFWVESCCLKFSKQIGANFYSDLRGNSRIRFLNKEKWTGLRELNPDIIIEKGEQTMVIDVKYKKHLLYFKLGNIPREILDEHRRDIHQILAYVGSSSSLEKKGVLVYPRLLKKPVFEKAEVLNYRNSNVKLSLFKIDTPFNLKELLNLLNLVWKSGF